MSTLKPAETAIVIPAFNEESTIRQIVEKSLVHTRHLIVVDDGSSDSTVAQIKDLPITLIQHKENKGKGHTLSTGFAEALERPVENIITIDADGQHAPSDIERLIKGSAQYPEHFIIAARMKNQENSPKHRLRANKTADFFISIAAKTWVKDTQSGFRAYPSSLLRQVAFANPKNKGFVFESKIIIDAVHMGYPIAMLPIDAYYPDDARKSHYKWLSDSIQIALMVSSSILKTSHQVNRLFKMFQKEGKKILLLED